jgi:uncharacterized protein YdiU (UPF0061 family)
LAAATTGNSVFRENAFPGAILIRIAKSHIRIGTFEFFSSRQDSESLKTLANHVMKRHYPEAENESNPILFMLNAVIENQARLIADWQQIGFIHGVMNTDNMLLSGETIDYGPCAFMDEFSPGAVFSSIDRHGRYAYGNQPSIGHWNLGQLAQVLFPLLDKNTETAREMAQEAIDRYPKIFTQAYLQNMVNKLGFAKAMPDDEKLIEDLLTIMTEGKMDYTLTFRQLSDLVARTCSNDSSSLITFPARMDEWLERWRLRLSQEGSTANERQKNMYAINPVYIPRNHLIEEAILAAVENGDFTHFHQIVEVLERPFKFDASLTKYALPPRPDQVVQQTFCGT